MNFKAIKRAEELRLNIERQDKEIIELERVMLNLALQDGQGLTMSLSVADPGTGRSIKSGKGYEPGGYPTKSIDTPFGSMLVFDNPINAGGMEGIFKTIRESAGNTGHLSEFKEQIISKPTKSTFVLTNGMALEFLNIYHERLTNERALAFKLLEECIKSLKVLD